MTLRDDSVHESSAKDFADRFTAFASSSADLPALPSAVWEIQAAIQNKLNNSADVSLVVEQDPSLSANILRAANSAYFSARTNFVSIRDAVTHIGRKQLERIVNTTIFIDVFSKVEGTLDYTNFWTHSLQVAEAAVFLTDRNTLTSPFVSSEAYIAGLLHDVGKLILDQYFPDDFRRVQSCVEKHQCTIAQAERDTIGMDHGEIAAGVLERWNLRPQLVEAIRWHHRVEDCKEEEYQPFAETVSRADALCHLCEQGAIPKENYAHPYLGLDEEGAQALMATVDDTMRRAVLLLK